jgi:DNA-binding GntR family transcriptional regulator
MAMEIRAMRSSERRRVRQTLKQEAAQYIRDQILSGALKPGSKIDQDRVADDLGISRIPVREAIITLEAEGMVETIARRGAFVAAITPTDIRDHYEMYGVLSGLAAKRSATQPDPGLPDRLSALIDKMRETEDPREQDRLNYEFHREVNLGGSSRRLNVVLRMLSTNMPTHFFEYNVEWQQHAETEHRAIVDAIREGDGDAAAAAVADHFRHVGEQAVHSLTKAGFWDDAGPAPASVDGSAPDG